MHEYCLSYLSKCPILDGSKSLLTGKSLSEALLFAEHVENMLCTKIVLNVRNNYCTEHVLPRLEIGIFMYWTCNSMNNCGFVDAKIRASDKDLPVLTSCFQSTFDILISNLRFLSNIFVGMFRQKCDTA